MLDFHGYCDFLAHADWPLPFKRNAAMLQDSVVAIVSDDTVRNILPAVHRAGLGHLARLVRANRSTALQQLQRAGVPVSQAPTSLKACPAVLLVAAAARSPMAASLLLQHGAGAVWIVSAQGPWIEHDDVILAQPNVHELPPQPARLVPGRGAAPRPPIAASSSELAEPAE